MSQSMNNCERAEMLRLMAEELKDSISAYEGAMKRQRNRRPQLEDTVFRANQRH
jgi:hypothetical protein